MRRNASARVRPERRSRSTVGMKCPIDVLFVGTEGHVKKTVAGLLPRRAAASFGAAATLELAEGSLQRLALLEAAELFWEEEA